jgi:fatty acid desaturase
LLVAVLAFHRGVSFLHELSHVRYAVPGWDFAWNVLVGIPLLLPSFVYSRVHVDHHAGAIFGTQRDPEYTRLRGAGRLRPVLMVLGSTCSPAVLALRWLLVAPLSLLHPRWRGFVVERLSSLTGKLDYARPHPRGSAAVRWSLLEAAASLWAWGLVIALATGALRTQVVVCAGVLAVSVSVLHALRSFGTHRFTASGEVLPFEAQFLDSVNFTGHPLLTELWAPAGLRYHALHHLAPDLPYHALGQAHRLLVAELPPDDLYHRATEHRIADLVRAVAKAVSDDAKPRA